MADKYPTKELIGVVVEQTNSGAYYPKNTPITAADFHSWRIGKHTKGKLNTPGQIFLTDNHQAVVLIDSRDLAFKDRHAFTPMERILKTTLDTTTLHTLTEFWERIQ